jgi:hypothetical protein
VAGWLTEQEARFGPMAALGIASFGPVDLDPASIAPIKLSFALADTRLLQVNCDSREAASFHF